MNTRLLISLTTLVVILACAVDAQAQLPVRTRQLQLLGATSGTMTQLADSSTTSYSVTWPAASPTWPPASGTTQYFLRAASGTGTASRLTWYGVNGDLVDNGGSTPANKYVAYWNDANTLTGEIGFQWDDATNTLTMGQAGQPAEVVFTNSSQSMTLQADTSVAAAHTYNLSSVTGGGTFFIPASTNKPTAAGQLLVSNAAGGSATWTNNPLAGFERGVVTPTPNAFTATIPITATVGPNDVIVITSYDISGLPNGNILSVTARGTNSFTITSSGPFLATEKIAYMYIPVP